MISVSESLDRLFEKKSKTDERWRIMLDYLRGEILYEDALELIKSENAKRPERRK